MAKKGWNLLVIISAFGHVRRTAAASIWAKLEKAGGTPAAHLVWPLALACGVLAFVTGSSVYLVFSAQTTGELVRRALRVQNELTLVRATVRDAESGQRGYFLTGDPKYLDVGFPDAGDRTRRRCL